MKVSCQGAAKGSFKRACNDCYQHSFQGLASYGVPTLGYCGIVLVYRAHEIAYTRIPPNPEHRDPDPGTPGQFKVQGLACLECSCRVATTVASSGFGLWGLSGRVL